jgi:hypothetical protein
MYLTIRRNAMRAQSILAVGFLSMMVTSGVVKASDSFASEGQRADVFERIGAGGSIYTQRQSVPVQSGKATVAGTERGKVDVMKRIGREDLPILLADRGQGSLSVLQSKARHIPAAHQPATDGSGSSE